MREFSHSLISLKVYNMAYSSNQPDSKKADGFLNLVVLNAKGSPVFDAKGKPVFEDDGTTPKFDGVPVPMLDTNGREIRLRKGIALDRTNRIERSLLNAAQNSADFVIALQGAVHSSAPEDDTDIAFA